MFLDDVGPPDLKEKWALPLIELAQFSQQSDRNCSGYETAWSSASSLPTFEPNAQSRFADFIKPVFVDESGILPGDVYGLGNRSLPRIEDKLEPAQIEESSVELALVQSVPNLTFSSSEGAPQDDIARWQDLHRSLSQRYTSNAHVADLLAEGGYVKESISLRSCGQQLVFRQREDCGRLETWRVLYGCNQRFCAFCSRSKSNDKFRDIWPAVQAYSERKPYLRPCSVVLTYKDDTPEWAGLRLKEKIRRTQKALRKFIRLKEFKQHVAGGVWSIENTKNSSNNDHLHVHMLVFRMGYWVKADLENLWAKSTDGLGGWTWIESRRDIKSSLRETLKYSMKPASVESWTVDDAAQFVECKGLRLTSRFGELYGLKLTEDEKSRFDALRVEDEKIEPICPGCGRENEAIVDTPHTRLTADMELKVRSRSIRGP